jgi:hypothetical protein
MRWRPRLKLGCSRPWAASGRFARARIQSAKPHAIYARTAAVFPTQQVEARMQALNGPERDALHNAQQAALSKCRQATAEAKTSAVHISRACTFGTLAGPISHALPLCVCVHWGSCQVVRFVDAQLDREPSRKILLFAHHKTMLYACERALRDRSGPTPAFAMVANCPHAT